MNKIEMLKKKMEVNERNNKMLTLSKLKGMEPGIFDTGIFKDPIVDPNNNELRWVAVRGGINDWCIYYGKSVLSAEYIRDHGNKIYTKQIIRELVLCSDEAFGMYRY